MTKITRRINYGSGCTYRLKMCRFLLLFLSLQQVITKNALGMHLPNRADRRECSACVRGCEQRGTEKLCAETYHNYTIASMKPLSDCNCEEDGWSYPYLNPGGAAGGQHTWKCCFDHYCIPEP
ncbi:unnamed protein product [Amoebophrya sp. A25]|nr:unnamed protein product [Amoebophrya sp. A25]|eukprot:GSA25T00014739001.1